MNIQAPYVNAYIGFKDAAERPTAPLPIQNEATRLRNKVKNTLNAGSYGTGKTKWLCNMMVSDAVHYPGNFILTGRKKLNWFKSSTLNDLLKAIPPELLIKWDKNENEIIVQSKDPKRPSKIKYMQLDTSREALDQIQNMEIGAFAPDQIEQLDEEVFDAAAGRLRLHNSARQAYSTANPRGRNWVWKRWINGEGGKEYGYVEGKMWTKGVPPPESQADVTFAVTDNPYLPYDYIANLLNTYPQRWLDRYVFGGWDDFEGLVYSMWRDPVHLVAPFDIPDWWNRVVAYDFGHRNPMAIGFFAISPDGDLYLYDLCYGSGLWIPDQARELKAAAKRNGTDLDSVDHWPADPSIFNHDRAATIADEWEDEEIYWERANNDVEGGINRCATYLTPNQELISPQYPHGKPQFFVFNIPATEPFVEEIKNYTWDDMHPEKPEKKNDHAMDMWRYVINAIEDSEEPLISKTPWWYEDDLQISTSWMSV
ncbi:MAG TPA: hypothetical protein ENI27_02935 [bacterium]|nr:hypothetical protein [bacterium]